MKANYRARTARTANALEAAYGRPQWAGLRDPLDVLVQTLMNEVTTPKIAERAWEALRTTYPTWDGIMDAKPETVVRTLNRAGMAATKARDLVKIIQRIKRVFGVSNLDFVKTMSVREAMRALSSLEGVDQETSANVILTSLGREVVPVDRNIHRVLLRMGIVVGNATPEQAFEVLQPLVPPGRSYAFYINMSRLAREVCRATQPKCQGCPVLIECRYPAKNIPRPARR
jgi:endonuclease-3